MGGPGVQLSGPLLSPLELLLWSAGQWVWWALGMAAQEPQLGPLPTCIRPAWVLQAAVRSKPCSLAGSSCCSPGP